MHVNFWTRQGCKTLFSNSSHTICSFDYISTYALIQTPDSEAHDLKILPIVIISITNCCVAAIILTLVVLCWRRVQVRFCVIFFVFSLIFSVFSLYFLSHNSHTHPFHQTDFFVTHV